MTHSVRFRPEARDDLVALYQYISEQSGHHRATLYVDRIEALCQSLSTFPARGVPRDDLAPGIRLLTWDRRIVVAYVIEGLAVRVVRVFSAGRDYEGWFAQGEP